MMAGQQNARFNTHIYVFLLVLLRVAEWHIYVIHLCQREIHQKCPDDAGHGAHTTRKRLKG